MAKQPCRCGRRWEAVWYGQFSYWPRCPGCGKKISECDCAPLEKRE